MTKPRHGRRSWGTVRDVLVRMNLLHRVENLECSMATKERLPFILVTSERWVVGRSRPMSHILSDLLSCTKNCC